MEHLEIISGPIVTTQGVVSPGSPIVTVADTSILAGAVYVSGPGLPPQALVQSIDSKAQVTLNVAALPSATGGQVPLSFGLEPVTLAEAKAHLRLQIPDDDWEVARLIDQSRRTAETMLRKTLLTTVYDWYLDQFPASANGYYNRLIRLMGPNPQWLPNGASILYVPNPPLVTVASIQYRTPTFEIVTVDPSIYYVSTGIGSRIQPYSGHVWPVVTALIDSVIVRYTAGYPTADSINSTVKGACLLMIGHWYEHREYHGDAQIYAIPDGVDRLISADDPGIYA
jgi:hypothetical protein